MFTDKERDFINSQRLVRIATATPSGRPHVVPSTFKLEGDLVLVTGWEMERSYKFSQAERNPWVALVWDASEPGPPTQIFGVEVRGTARVLRNPDAEQPNLKAVIEVTPTKVFSWGINEHVADSFHQKMGYPEDHPLRPRS